MIILSPLFSKDLSAAFYEFEVYVLIGRKVSCLVRPSEQHEIY